MKDRIFINRAAIVAGVLGIAMLGHLRSQASEPASASPYQSKMTTLHPQAGFDTMPVADAKEASVLGTDVDGDVLHEFAGSLDGDDGQLVPAIYAWDPDVRFVYYRHVSKWM